MARNAKFLTLAIAALLIAISSHLLMRTPQAAPAVPMPAALSPNSLTMTATPISESWDAN